MQKNHWPLTEGVFVNRPEARFTGAEGLVQHCQTVQAQIQAWSPVAGGDLSQDASKIKDERHAAICQAVSELARRYDASPEAIGLAWLLTHPAAIVPIVGTTKPERLKSMAKAAELSLSSDDWWTLFNASLGRRLP